MTTAIATAPRIALPTTPTPDAWTPEEKALLDFAGLIPRKGGREYPAPLPVVLAFLQQCDRTQLDPIARQIYAIERGGKWTIQVSIDGMRLVAQRSRLYRGQSKPQWTDGSMVRTPMRDLDGSIVREGDGSIVWEESLRWLDVWNQEGQPLAARVAVYRADFDEPLWAVARFDAYAVLNDVWEGDRDSRRKTGAKELSAMWQKMGAEQLAKCAEALALRKAFPMDLSGLYATEEMEHLDVVDGSRGGARPAPALAAGTRSAQRDPIPADAVSDAAEGQEGMAGPGEPESPADRHTGPDEGDSVSGGSKPADSAADPDADPLGLTEEERAEYGLLDGGEGGA